MESVETDLDAPRSAGPVRDFVTDTACCLRFYSRLPVPPLPWEHDPHAPPRFRTMARALPVAGAMIGAVGALVLVLALVLGLGPLLSAAVAIAALTLATGAFHEDGLADTADGFGGGLSPERRLEIMKDSRIGSYGGAALVLAFALRILALATLAERVDPAAAAAALVLVAAMSRTGALILMMLLAPARMVGSSYVVGRPSGTSFAVAVGLCAALSALAAAGTALTASSVALAAGLVVAAALVMARLSQRLIAGYTGDVGGATQQVAEIAAWLAILIGLRA